jgi:hypothetical protein
MTLRRTAALPRSPMPDRTVPMRRASEKRLKAAGGWLASTILPKRPSPAVPSQRRKTLADRSGGVCEARLDGCSGRAIDPHHRVIRQRGGRQAEAKERSDQLSGLLHLCRFCHDWVHDHPEKARQIGLLLRQHQIPAQELVAYRGEPSYLDPLGRVWSAEEVGA